MDSPPKRDISTLMFFIWGAVACFVIGVITLVIDGPSMAFFGVGGILMCIALGMLISQLRRRPDGEAQPLDDRKYLWMMVFLILIGLPLLSQLLALAGIALNSTAHIPVWLCTLAGVLIVAGCGFLLGLKIHLPDRFSMRYLPLLLAITYLLTVWDIAMLIGRGSFADSGFSGVIMVAFLPYSPVNIAAAFSGKWWSSLLIPLATYTAFLLGLAVGAWHSGRAQVAWKGWATSFTALIAAAVVCGCQAAWRDQTTLAAGDGAVRVNEEISWWLYRPFHEKSLLTPVRGQPKVTIAAPYPRLDGATALFPVYASAVQAIYAPPANIENIDDAVEGSTTPYAYERLMRGDADLIFVAEPSTEQIQAAHDRGLELTLTPIAKEAFVFLVHRENPVHNLTLEQVRAVYAGEITNWKAVGGQDEKILAFQRPAGSGSQTVMLAKVMRGKEMSAPLQEEVHKGMGGLVQAVAAYRNYAGALGYSFRYYATRMKTNGDIRLLAIDEIEPTVENIRNGSYPLTGNVYMVAARPPSENTRKLMDWFLSPQGKQLIEDVGYVAIP